MEEEADAAAIFADRTEEIMRPNDAEWPAWSGYIREAFQQLRDDRHYGAMGGLGRIWFSSITDYADRYGILGDAFDRFVTCLRAIDDENIVIQNERAKAEAERNKNKS